MSGSSQRSRVLAVVAPIIFWAIFFAGSAWLIFSYRSQSSHFYFQDQTIDTKLAAALESGFRSLVTTCIFMSVLPLTVTYGCVKMWKGTQTLERT